MTHYTSQVFVHRFALTNEIKTEVWLFIGNRDILNLVAFLKLSELIGMDVMWNIVSQ
jgi:hypothetical protein